MVAVDQSYSVKVEYTWNSDTIYVVDAARIKLKRVSEACDEVCWVIAEDKIDATLKFN